MSLRQRGATGQSMTEQQKRNLAAACMVAGMIALAFGAWTSFRGVATTSWAQATGTVVTSRVTAVADGPDRADVVYRYAVNGRSYDGERIGYGRFTTEAGARAFVAAHPEGSEVVVFYDGSNPASAVLERGGLATGAVAILIGVLLLIGSRRLKTTSAA
jgi:hypothetical protein